MFDEGEDRNKLANIRKSIKSRDAQTGSHIAHDHDVSVGPKRFLDSEIDTNDLDDHKKSKLDTELTNEDGGLQKTSSRTPSEVSDQISDGKNGNFELLDRVASTTEISCVLFILLLFVNALTR